MHKRLKLKQAPQSFSKFEQLRIIPEQMDVNERDGKQNHYTKYPWYYNRKDLLGPIALKFLSNLANYKIMLLWFFFSLNYL